MPNYATSVKVSLESPLPQGDDLYPIIPLGQAVPIILRVTALAPSGADTLKYMDYMIGNNIPLAPASAVANFTLEDTPLNPLDKSCLVMAGTATTASTAGLYDIGYIFENTITGFTATPSTVGPIQFGYIACVPGWTAVDNADLSGFILTDASIFSEIANGQQLQDYSSGNSIVVKDLQGNVIYNNDAYQPEDPLILPRASFNVPTTADGVYEVIWTLLGNGTTPKRVLDGYYLHVPRFECALKKAAFKGNCGCECDGGCVSGFAQQNAVFNSLPTLMAEQGGYLKAQAEIEAAAVWAVEQGCNC
jgi:hypothetical protein